MLPLNKNIGLFTGIMAGILAIMLLISCSSPLSVEDYKRTKDRDIYGRFEFSADMSDSLAAYSVDLLISMGCNKKKFSTFENAPLRIMWVSPSGKPFEEEVWLSRLDLSSETPVSKQFMVKYRRGLVPKEYGVWKLYIALSDNIIVDYNIPGIGVRLNKEL